MASAEEQSRDVFFSGTDNYLRCAFVAQQEFFQLGMNLLQREMDTGRRIVGSRDFSQAFAAYADLMSGTMEDFSASTSRLFEQLSATGAKMVEDTAEGVQQVSALTTEAARNVQETVEKAEQVVRASVRRGRKSGQAATSAEETAERMQTPADTSEPRRPAKENN